MIEKKSRATVGIIDDHPHLLKVMKSVLTLLNYSVILKAENGKVFIEKLDSRQLPDICLLDLNMPLMNGFETTAYLKRNWPAVKVLIYSMNQDIQSREKAFACGADGYLVKPSTVDEKEAAIERIVQP